MIRPALPQEVCRLFWNLDCQGLDIGRDRRLIIDTVLPRGGAPALRWLFATYGKRAIRAHLQTTRASGLSPEDLCLWREVLGETAPCASGIDRWRITRTVPAGPADPA